MPYSIAIDGPVGAGKSTVAHDVAKELGILHLDTGAMYRAIGLKMLRAGLDPADEAAATALSARTKVSVVFEQGIQRTLLDGEDVTDSLRTPEVGNAASTSSKWQAVRDCMLVAQRCIAAGMDMVLDGRDIGTRVLPDATLKVFLTSSPQVRARRRFDEMIAKGMTDTYEMVLRDLEARDAQDTQRAIDPLRQAEDAVLVDTSDMTQAQVVARVIALFQARIQRLAEEGEAQ